MSSRFSKSAITFSAGEQMNSQFLIPFVSAFSRASSIAEASMSTPMSYIRQRSL